MKMFLSVVVALAVLGGVLYLVAPYLKTAEPAIVEEEGTEEAGVEVRTERIQEGDAAYTIDVSYPQFSIAKIDAQIKEVVSNSVTEFKSLPANPAGSATPQNSFDGSFDSVY